MKKIYLIILLASLLVIAGCSTEEQDGITGQASEPKTYTVEITTDGSFVPAELTIKQGDTVTWVNKWTKDSWPASASHPTHEVYPGSSIEKCDTGEQSGIFDACKGLKPGESWSFTFNEKGSWGYHDHINFPGKFGKVIVE
ncbi:MAG: plastocyanin/azurin family copper-binding protein [Nanoarchaeota archaeon]